MYAYTLVSSTTVTSPVTSIVITGLNITSDDNYMLITEGIPNGAYTNTILTANGLSSNSFYSQILNANGTSLIAGRYNYPDYRLTYDGSQGKTIASIKLTNDGYFTYKSCTANRYPGVSTYKIDTFVSSIVTMSNITSLEITAGTASSIGTGTVVKLYKLSAEKIADVQITTATTSVTLSGLDMDNNGEYILFCNIKNTISAGSNIYSFFNNNTTQSNYSSQYTNASSTSIVNARANDSHISDLISSTSNVFFSASFRMTNNGNILFVSENIPYYGTSNIVLRKYFVTSISTFASLTSISLNGSITNTFGIGSRVELYKLI